MKKFIVTGEVTTSIRTIVFAEDEDEARFLAVNQEGFVILPQTVEDGWMVDEFIDAPEITEVECRGEK